MVFLAIRSSDKFHTTDTQGFLGGLIYSDTYSHEDPRANQRSFLNKWAAIPILGCLAGVARVALAIVHIIGHLLAAIPDYLIFKDTNHLCHAAKGSTELLRGCIETMPIIGNVFVWLYDAPSFCTNGDFEYSFFIIKIYNPNNPDPIDLHLNVRNLFR